MRRYTVPCLLIVIRPVAAHRHGARESSSDPRGRRGMGVALGSDLAEKILRPAFAAADGRSPPHFQSPCASARGAWPTWPAQAESEGRRQAAGGLNADVRIAGGV